jgi:3-dehydroquinate dehydratase/shikimate dehydrogenase
VYVPFRVPHDLLLPTLKAFESLDVQGYSVTIPHKEQSVQYVRYPDATVKDAGAANTLYRDDRGKWFATNTDLEAAMRCLRMGLEMKEPDDPHLSGKKVLLLGAGGAARAIGLGVSRAGAALVVCNRSKKRGKELAEQLNCQFINWENRGSVLADVLINCTPVGMFPNVEETPFPQHWLRDGMLVFDTVYNPENTLLLKQAREHLCFTVSGLEMFVLQAAAQFECFVKKPAPLDFLRETLRQGISPVRLN